MDGVCEGDCGPGGGTWPGTSRESQCDRNSRIHLLWRHYCPMKQHPSQLEAGLVNIDLTSAFTWAAMKRHFAAWL